MEDGHGSGQLELLRALMEHTHQDRATHQHPATHKQAAASSLRSAAAARKGRVRKDSHGGREDVHVSLPEGKDVGKALLLIAQHIERVERHRLLPHKRQ